MSNSLEEEDDLTILLLALSGILGGGVFSVAGIWEPLRSWLVEVGVFTTENVTWEIGGGAGLDIVRIVIVVIVAMAILITGVAAVRHSKARGRR